MDLPLSPIKPVNIKKEMKEVYIDNDKKHLPPKIKDERNRKATDVSTKQLHFNPWYIKH